MTSPDDRHHEREQLFADLLAGDRSLTDPEVQDAMRDESCRREWDELQGMQVRLDRAGNQERAALAGAGAGASSAVDPVVARTIARLAGVPVAGASPPPSSKRRLVMIGVIAAAAAVLAWLWLWSLPGDGRDDDRKLGPQPLERLGVVETEDGGLELSWTSTLPDATFTVSVYDPDQPDAEPVAAREQSPETSWIVDAKFVAGRRPGLRWRVVAHVKGRTVERDWPLR